MNRLLILCVESNKKARTDYIYVSSAIKRFYVDDKKNTYKPVFLDTKTKYNDKKKIKEIKELSKNFKGEIKVIYFIDVDDYDISYETKKLFDEIERYCQDNNYDLVFFCKDVEDVFLGDTVSNDEKVKKAASFNRSKKIDSVNEQNLKVSSKKRHCSNILIVLDKYFTRKKDK